MALTTSWIVSTASRRRCVSSIVMRPCTFPFVIRHSRLFRLPRDRRAGRLQSICDRLGQNFVALEARNGLGIELIEPPAESLKELANRLDRDRVEQPVSDGEERGRLVPQPPGGQPRLLKDLAEPAPAFEAAAGLGLELGA